jgi:D-erythronate 2-dehydrogenase
MRVVLLGGAGFLGQKLVRALLEKGQIQHRQIDKLVVFDKFQADVSDDKRLEVITGDIADKATLERLILSETDVVIHLAAIVSGEAEKNFDLGMQVNLLAAQNLLEICRGLPKPPKFLFASSVAVFGGDMPEVIEDATAPVPQSSYGTQKAIVELLVNDYSRRGFIDGLSLRLPTIVVRPGKPNAATTTFASSIIREPLQGERAICPVSADTELWILSPRQVIRSILKALDLDSSSLGKNRTLSLPGITVSVQDMVKALEVIAGKKVIERIDWKPDPFIQKIVGSFPGRFMPTRALALGFEADPSMTEIIQNFVEDDLT